MARKAVPWKELAAAGTKGGQRLARMVRGAIRNLAKGQGGKRPPGVYLVLGDSEGAAVEARPAEPFAPANHHVYRAHLFAKSRWRRTPQTFWSLGGPPGRPTGKDSRRYFTRLVVPAKPADDATYAQCGDVLSFSALTIKSQGPLWQAVIAEAAAQIRAGHNVVVWTHGREVPWLHVRVRLTRAPLN